MTERIGMRVGEALVAGGPPGTAAEPEVVIGDLNGPFGTAFATMMGDQVAGHSRVLALLNTDVMVRPPTLCVSKVTVDNERYTNVLMGTVQYATAMGVLDSVRENIIPKAIVNDVGIIASLASILARIMVPTDDDADLPAVADTEVARQLEELRREVALLRQELGRRPTDQEGA